MGSGDDADRQDERLRAARAGKESRPPSGRLSSALCAWRDKVLDNSWHFAYHPPRSSPSLRMCERAAEAAGKGAIRTDRIHLLRGWTFSNHVPLALPGSWRPAWHLRSAKPLLRACRRESECLGGAVRPLIVDRRRGAAPDRWARNAAGGFGYSGRARLPSLPPTFATKFSESGRSLIGVFTAECALRQKND